MSCGKLWKWHFRDPIFIAPKPKFIEFLKGGKCFFFLSHFGQLLVWLSEGLLTWRREDPRRRIKFTLGSHAEILVCVVPKYRMFEKKLKMAGDKNKHTICALLLSLLALTTSFQQNYHNNQLVVTPNEMVGLYAPWLATERPAFFP